MAPVGDAEPRSVQLARRGATVAIVALALGLSATMGWGDALVASGQAAAAAALPGNSSVAGIALIEASGRASPAPTVVVQARRALLNSPLAGEALTALALDAASRGADAAAIRLLDLSGRTGWHDETGRRQLFNLAVARGDAANALYHADALLRQGLAHDELYGSLVAGCRDPLLRKALVAYITRPSGWPQDWLAIRGISLPDDALEAFASERARSLHGLDRATASPILSGLIATGRLDMAARIWRMVAGADGLGSGTLDWDRSLGRGQPTPFDWSLPGGVAVSGARGESVVMPRGSEPIVVERMLALAPGNYRLTFADDTPGGWRWRFGCGKGGAAPVDALAVEAIVSVPAGCPVQHIAFAPSALAIAAAPLGTPRLTRLP